MAPVLMCVNVYEYVVCCPGVNAAWVTLWSTRRQMLPTLPDRWKSQLPSLIGCLKSHEGVLFFATQAQTVHAALISRPFCVRCRGLEPSWWRGPASCAAKRLADGGPPLKIKIRLHPFLLLATRPARACGIGITCPDIKPSIALVFVDELQGSPLDRR